MAIKSATGTGAFSVGDTTPVKLNVNADDNYPPGSSLVITSTGPLYFGRTNSVANTGANRGSLQPAVTMWPVKLDPGEDLYAIAPSGQTVSVEVLQGGVA